MDETTVSSGVPPVSTGQEQLVLSIALKTFLQNTTIPNTSNSVTLSTNYTTNPNVSDVLLDIGSNIEQRFVEILRNEYNTSAFQYFSKLAGIPSYTLPTTTTLRIPYTSGVVSWGFITPITMIGIFLMVVAVCLCYHNWLDKRRLRNYAPAVPVSNFSRIGSANTKLNIGPRGSIRSNCSARSMGSNTFDKRQMLPLPRKASLRLTHIEEGWKITGQPRVQLSPIDENDLPNSKMTFTEVKPKFERCSSYHITWISETTKDAKLRNDLGNSRIHVTDNPLPNQLRNDQLYEIALLEQKSPYHPHHNTPTDDYEGESECSRNLHGGDSAASTHINDNISLPSTIYPITGQAPPSLTDGADISSIHTYLDSHRPPSSRRDDFTVPSGQVSTTTSFTESASGTLSLPSSISRFHASRINNTPNHPYPLASTHNGSQVKLNFTVTSNIDLSENNSQYSDNTSMFPNVGSSITSFAPSVALSNPTSSCPSDILSPDYIYDKVDRPMETRQNSFSTNSEETYPLRAEISQTNVAREAEMFRNWSLSPGVNSGSLNNLPCLAPTSFPSCESYSINQKDDSVQSKSEGHITSNSYDINGNLSPIDNRKVKFSFPVLNKKQYWV